MDSHIVLTNPVEDMSYVVTSKDMQFTFLYTSNSFGLSYQV